MKSEIDKKYKEECSTLLEIREEIESKTTSGMLPWRSIS